MGSLIILLEADASWDVEGCIRIPTTPQQYSVTGPGMKGEERERKELLTLSLDTIGAAIEGCAAGGVWLP